MKLENISKHCVAIYTFLLIGFCFALFEYTKPEPEEIKNVTQLLKKLDNSDPKIREQAAYGFYNLGGSQMYDHNKDFEAKKSEIIIALRKRLSDKETKVSFEAANALIEIDAADNSDIVIPLMLKYLDDINPETRKRAAWKLNFYRAALGTRKEEVTTALKKHLNDENARVRYETAIALGSIDHIKFQSIILPTLVEILNSDKEPATIYHTLAAEACEEIGPPAVKAVPALIELTKAKETTLKFIYAAPLKSIGTPEALEAVKEAERVEKMWHLKGVLVNCAIILCFVLFFGWSVMLRKRGKKVIHWFLLAPIAVYSLVLTYNLRGDSSAVETVLSIKFFLVLASIGCIPWLISWFLLRRRESQKPTEKL